MEWSSLCVRKSHSRLLCRVSWAFPSRFEMVAALLTIRSKIKMILAVLSIVRQMRERPDSVEQQVLVR